jgi:hypothetical protein
VVLEETRKTGAIDKLLLYFKGRLVPEDYQKISTHVIAYLAEIERLSGVS